MSSPHEGAAPPAVPKFNRDPVASLRLHTLQFSYGGQEFETVQLTAADWLQVLMELEDLTLLDVLVDFLPEEDGHRFITTFMTQDGDIGELFLNLLEQASGRLWWVAMRLVAVCLGAWQLVGSTLLLLGHRPDTMTLAAWLDIFTLKMLEMIKPDQATMLLMQIEMPPDGVELSTEDMEMSAEDFLSLG